MAAVSQLVSGWPLVLVSARKLLQGRRVKQAWPGGKGSRWVRTRPGDARVQPTGVTSPAPPAARSLLGSVMIPTPTATLENQTCEAIPLVKFQRTLPPPVLQMFLGEHSPAVWIRI